MSRVGRKPITIPSGVEVKINGSDVTVKGPKGTISRKFHNDITISLEENQLIVTRPSDEKNHRALHGTTRSLLSNMIEGVTNGFQRGLDIVGVGYRASLQGAKLVLALGYSHPIEYTPEAGIEIEVPSQTKIVVKGVDKERVGEVAAKIRSYRQPEPYKGKGIKYDNEIIRRKEGKTGKKK